MKEDQTDQPVNFKLRIVLGGEFAQDKTEHIGILLNMEDNVKSWVCYAGLQPTEPLHYSEYGKDELVRSFDFKMSKDQDSTLTLQFERDEHASESNKLFDDGTSNEPPFFTIHAPLRIDTFFGIDHSISPWLADLVLSACNNFKLKVANRLGLTDTYKMWAQQLRNELPAWFLWESEEFIGLYLIEDRSTVFTLWFCDMLDLRSYEEFKTIVEKKIKEMTAEQ